MTTADSTTSDEPGRLSTLASYEPWPEGGWPALDALCAAAATVVGVPLGVVNLVEGEALITLAGVGAAPGRSPRAPSFCRHVVAARDRVVVPDTLEDARFRDSPYVVDAPHVRFYAGFPLRTAEGDALGTLCVMGPEPQQPSDDQLELLGVLADQAMAQLELHRQLGLQQQATTAQQEALDRLRTSERRYRLLAQNATDVVSRHAADGTVRWVSPSVTRVLGHDAEAELGTSPARHVHPDDLALFAEALAALPRQLGPQTVTARARHADGRWRWLETTLSGVFGDDGALEEVHSAARDVTARTEAAAASAAAELRYRALVEQTPDAILVHVGAEILVANASADEAAEALARASREQDRLLFEQSPVALVQTDGQGRLLRANAAFARLIGRAPQEVTGRLLRELAEGHHAEGLASRAAAGEDDPVVDRTFRRPDGTQVEATVSATVLRDDDGSVRSLVVTVVDMTERNHARRALEALVGDLRAARDEAQQRSEVLAAVLATIDVGVVACDAHGRLTLFNRATREFTGLVEDPDVEPGDWAARYALLAEDGLTPLTPEQVPLYRALVEGEVRDAHITIAPPGLPARLVRCDGRALHGPGGELTGAVVAMKDVTELRASEQRFRAAFLQGPTPIARLDPDGTVREVNPALRRFLALPSRLLLGHRMSTLVHPLDADALADALAGTAEGPVELRVRRSDGTDVWCELATSRSSTPHGPAYVLAQLVDVHARKLNELVLEQAAQVDPLTGLGNRSVLDRELQAVLDPHSGRGGCVLFVDLDDFKAVNDTLGHDAGDAVLAEVARRVRQALRPTDVAVRTGGDEFVVVCSVEDAVEAAAVAEALAGRLEQLLSEPVLHDGQPVPIGASVGAAVGRPGQDPTEVVARADRAMYERKQSRRRAQPPRQRRPDVDEIGVAL